MLGDFALSLRQCEASVGGLPKSGGGPILGLKVRGIQDQGRIKRKRVP